MAETAVAVAPEGGQGAASAAGSGRAFHFISGLPRAGSTLTAAILRQNPRFHDLLVVRPAEMFKLICDFLGEAPFDHDFERVEYDAPAFDAQLGIDGLHRVHPQVMPRPRKTILPPDLFQRYARLAFWRDLTDSKAFRIVIERGTEPQDAAMPPPATVLAGDGA